VIFLPPYGNRERLIGFLGMCRKGKTEQVDATNGDSTNDVKQTSPALVISSHFCVVFHGSDCLIWDNMTGSVIHCLHHGESKSSCNLSSPAH
jgi:hypothetical protein